MGTNRHQEQFGGFPLVEERKPRRRYSIGGKSAVLLVALLVLGVTASVLARIVEQAGNPRVVLVLGSHVGVGAHAQKLLADPLNGAGMAHKTAVPLGKFGVILSRSRRAALEEPRAHPLIEEEAHEVAQVLALDVLNFTLKISAVHRKLSLVSATTLNVLTL